MSETSPSSSAEVIARYILEQSPPHRMSAMKLQKLLYYCEAWSLAWDDRDIIGEPIEAWSEGPVVRSVWEKTNPAYEVSSGEFTGDLSALDSKAHATIRSVLKFYGERSDGDLGDMIEVEEPWRRARGNHPSDALIPAATIDPEVMKEYYRKLGGRTDVPV